MNKKVNLSTEVLKTIYEENKRILIPIGVILVSILLIIFFVLPQANGYFKKQELIKEEQGKLNNLSDNKEEILEGVSYVRICPTKEPPDRSYLAGKFLGKIVASREKILAQAIK